MVKIACIIVTYNRKELLGECLEAILTQKFLPHTAYIIDNASTDGTMEFLMERGFYNTEHGGINFVYVNTQENTGGAGGFYIGMKTAFESQHCFDGFWLMDDDGIPDSDQLALLVARMGEYDYISPLVLAKENHNHMAFGKLDLDGIRSISTNGIAIGRANPFNGILYSRRLVAQVGYPEKDMFIWGDEWQYHLRAKKAGYDPITVIDAIHYHPRDKQPVVVTRGEKIIVFPPQEWKLYCYCRNKVYYHYVNNKFIKVLKISNKIMMDYYYYLYKNGYKFRTYWIVFRAVMDGVFKNLKRLKRYM